jgi:hypothetical protein
MAPLLELNKLDVEARELPLVFLPLQLTVGGKFTLLVGHRRYSHDMARA